MSSRQAKRCRALANREAKRRGLWKQGEKSIYGKWWRRLLALFFPKARAKYLSWIGRWYKSTLKKWAKEAYRNMHDQEVQSYLKTREKMRKISKRQR